jgi:DNA-binding transcriptional regulator YdaS (Cro superfamily)
MLLKETYMNIDWTRIPPTLDQWLESKQALAAEAAARGEPAPAVMSKVQISRLLGVTPGRISQLSSERVWPPEMALDVERVTRNGMDASYLNPLIAEARNDKAARRFWAAYNAMQQAERLAGQAEAGASSEAA